MESTCTEVYMSPNKCTYIVCERKIFAKSFSGWGTDRNMIKISCHSRLFFVLHLLVNSVIIMVIARKAVEHVFISIQFFSYLRKQGWLFSLGALILFRMGFFGAAHGWGGTKKPPSPSWNLPYLSYNNKTWHSHTLPKEDPKNI